MGDGIDPSLFPVPYGPAPVQAMPSPGLEQTPSELLDGVESVIQIVEIFGNSGAQAAPIGVAMLITWLYTRLIQGKPLNPFKKVKSSPKSKP